MSLSELLHRLHTDHTSGASTLLALAIDILETFTAQSATHEADNFHAALSALVQTLLAAQPSMAPLINLVNQALLACPETLTPPMARQQLQHMLTARRAQTHASITRLCQQALVALPPGATVLTYSNSATVIAALQHAYARGRVQRVVLSESRPAYDGRPQALALLAHGMAIEYSIDMALFDRLPEAHVVLVWADAVLPHGLVNKLGTRPLALMARRCGIPMFSLCTSDKFLPATAVPLLHIVDHPGQEVWPEAPPGVSIRNRYFDVTPLPLFSGIISQHGIYAPAALHAHLQRQQVAPTLLQLAAHPAAGDEHGTFATHGAALEHVEER
jgi:translation initiation factor eIF-2B subunit delta